MIALVNTNDRGLVWPTHTLEQSMFNDKEGTCLPLRSKFMEDKWDKINDWNEHAA